jgi:hypothetical protein
MGATSAMTKMDMKRLCEENIKDMWTRGRARNVENKN